MASVFTPEFPAGSTVWVITTATDSCPSAVREGVVIQAKATELTSGQTFKFDIRLNGNNGTTEFLESEIYATINAAMDAYTISMGGSPA